MRSFGLIAVVVLVAANARDDAAKKDLAKFQGNWQLISAERDETAHFAAIFPTNFTAR